MKKTELIKEFNERIDRISFIEKDGAESYRELFNEILEENLKEDLSVRESKRLKIVFKRIVTKLKGKNAIQFFVTLRYVFLVEIASFEDDKLYNEYNEFLEKLRSNLVMLHKTSEEDAIADLVNIFIYHSFTSYTHSFYNREEEVVYLKKMVNYVYSFIPSIMKECMRYTEYVSSLSEDDLSKREAFCAELKRFTYRISYDINLLINKLMSDKVSPEIFNEILNRWFDICKENNWILMKYEVSPIVLLEVYDIEPFGEIISLIADNEELNFDLYVNNEGFFMYYLLRSMRDIRDMECKKEFKEKIIQHIKLLIQNVLEDDCRTEKTSVMGDLCLYLSYFTLSLRDSKSFFDLNEEDKILKCLDSYLENQEIYASAFLSSYGKYAYQYIVIFLQYIDRMDMLENVYEIQDEHIIGLNTKRRLNVDARAEELSLIILNCNKSLKLISDKAFKYILNAKNTSEINKVISEIGRKTKNQKALARFFDSLPANEKERGKAILDLKNALES